MCAQEFRILQLLHLFLRVECRVHKSSSIRNKKLNLSYCEAVNPLSHSIEIRLVVDPNARCVWKLDWVCFVMILRTSAISLEFIQKNSV
jgi:hypothetical protein